MRSKKIKLLTLLYIGLCLGLYIMLTQSTDYYLLYQRMFGKFVLRIIICCTALCYYLHLHKKKHIQHPVQSYTHTYRFTISTICAQLTMSFALTLLSSIKATLWHPSVQPVLHFSSGSDFLYRGIIEITLLSALIEELLFRGILEKLLRKVIQTQLWITMLSALAFSLMHCNLSNNLLYFVMGCFLSYLYRKTQRIIYPIIAHGLHNLCATSIMYFTLDQTLDLIINSLPIVTRFILAIAALLTAYGYIIFMSPKTKNIP